MVRMLGMDRSNESAMLYLPYQRELEEGAQAPRSTTTALLRHYSRTSTGNALSP